MAPMEGVPAGWDSDPALYPVLCWDPQHGWDNQCEQRPSGLQSIADCHFSVAGFVHVKDLPRCEELGLKAFVYGDTEDTTLRQWNGLWDDTDLSDALIEDKVGTMIERAGDSPALLGYYICDEPGTALFPRLAKAVECVRARAPGKLAYINLFPDYATLGAPDMSQLEADTYEEYLERFITEVRPQLLSYDNYNVLFSNDQAKAETVESYYRNLLDIRDAGLRHGLPFWNIVSSNQIRPYTTIPSPANFALQAYTSLAAGARGVTWFTYYAREYGYAPVDSEGERTTTWYALQEVNRQLSVLGPIMNSMVSTGVYFSSPAPAAGLPVLPGKLVAQVEVDGPVMVGEFSDSSGGQYAMVVNLSLERSVHCKVQAASGSSDSGIVSSVSGKPQSLDSKGGHWLAAGQGVLVRL